MSKAFTSEDIPAPDIQPEAPRLAPGEVRYVTPEGHRALHDELAALPPSSRRAQALASILPQLTVHAPRCEGRAVFGCWVRLRDEAGRDAIWRLVGPDEADARARRLSIDSPLARELLGKAAGDAISLELPKGPVDYEVIEVSGAPPKDVS